MRYLLVLSARMQAVDTGKINQKDLMGILQLRLSHAVLDGDAREVGHFLTKARQPVEQR